MDQRILVVEDEKDLAHLLEYTLTREGFEVLSAPTGSQALNLMDVFKPDLLILDLMLPDMSGLEICKALKRESKYQTIAVIILTARGMESDRVAGLELGADDYITKPFSTKELVLRVKTLLARTDPSRTAVLQIGPLTIDYKQHLVFKNGKKAQLTFTQFKILNILASQRGRVFSRNQLLDSVWGQEVVVSDRAVDVQIKRLKDRLKFDLGVEGLIATIRGVGYKIEP